MQVILLKDVKGVGKQHDVVEVKDGYAKNFLLKNKLAVTYTSTAKVVLNKNLADLDEKEQEKVQQANALKDQIETVTLNFTLKVHNGNAFGTISFKQIIDELSNKFNIKIDKFMIEEKNKNISLGIHNILLKIYKHISANLKVIVTGEE
ncbi:MAG: 50S ribosomal protein L9 [Mycoplasmataceae bacterium]|jgi:large subunit ribosomal protein L9|nr:50S ribosomal protein L9 [Mycoplasmataceae bacterium]